jgi:hypothetical protein
MILHQFLLCKLLDFFEFRNYLRKLHFQIRCVWSAFLVREDPFCSSKIHIDQRRLDPPEMVIEDWMTFDEDFKNFENV